MKTYSGEALRAVAMPIGGIGTGNIAVAGDGSLRQWQIHHQINHQATVPHSFFAISIDGPQGRVARVLQSNALYNSPGETPPPTSSDAVVPPAHRELLATLPGVTGTEFCGPYPFANVAYQDEALPLDIRMQAWNPMIPFNANDSGIPAITFTFTVHNPGTSTYTGTLAATQQNTIGWDGIAEISGTRCKLFGGNRNEDASGNGRTAVRMINDFLPAIAAGNGQTMLSTNAYGATTCTDWRDLEEFWPPFANYGHLPDSRNTGPTAKGETCNAAIGVPFTIEPHGTRTISFQIAWYFPNRYINWYQWDTFGVDDPKSQLWVGTHYATVFASVDDVSSYLWKNHDELLTQTRSFSDALTGGNLPEVLIDTVTAQMSIMRSPTCFWADDGNFYGFEGCNGFSTLHHAPGVTGSCPLNCTHVWNYEQSLAHLYPELDRTMRDTEWFLQQHPSGYLPHRVPLPRYVSRIWGRHIGGPDNPALDGLLGAILKTWREFRSTGDLAWLERCWPHVEQALVFIHEENDPDQQGTIEGEQPNTYDISIFGLNTFLGTLYSAALYAAGHMAERLGHAERAEQLRSMAANGSAIMEERLWQGEWYIQEVDLEQYSEQNWATGLHSDHLLGQWWADVLQLPSTLDPEHIRKAVESIFTYNFRENLEGIPTPERWFGVPSDAGLINCTWPHEGRPEVPTRYSDEVWTGLEYEVAALLISTGQMDKAMTLLQAVRDRYDGHRMNPWNDIECGDHYVRAMSSWSLLLAATDFGWDAQLGELTLGNRTGQERLVAPFFAAPAWGTYEIDADGDITIRVIGGEIEVKSVVVKDVAAGDAAVSLDRAIIEATAVSSEQVLVVNLSASNHLAKGSKLQITF
ncbi:MAG: non-lysosomal glucosylceramidase [Thermomicrobiales bacterium]|nr:non-lysosomal glucosylceramidase [Thermomicrobiales bacterium]MCO5229062.1 non-lysosomal glucosylceramidase [Thermomicrobiales bacterium]